MFHMFERMNQPQVTDGQSLLPLLKGAVLSCSIMFYPPSGANASHTPRYG